MMKLLSFNQLKSVFISFIPLAIAITLLSGTVYFAMQQVLRQSAYDPQVQIAEDTASKLSAGMNFNELIPVNRVDISTSLSSYIIVFNKSGTPIASNAQLNGQIPSVPSGVFDYVKQHGEDKFTWQPEDNVRSAVVVTSYSNGSNEGYVLAGRSLREVENRIESIGTQITLAWIITLLASYIGEVFVFWLRNREVI